MKFEEQVLSIDNFNEPKVVKKNKYIYLMIARLFLLEPGDIQSHPYMGIGLVSKYRYSESESAAIELQKEATDQVSKYLPHLQGVFFNIKAHNKMLNIEISIDGVLYDFNFNTETGTIEDLLNM